MTIRTAFDRFVFSFEDLNRPSFSALLRFRLVCSSLNERNIILFYLYARICTDTSCFGPDIMQ